MEFQKLLLIFSLLIFTLLSWNQSVTGSSHHHHHHHHHRHHDHLRHRHEEKRYVYGFRPTKLFVFGDSYADTGNIKKSEAHSWDMPYGITFPGKPAGRFSDGRVLTDYLAKFVGIKSPAAYRWISRMGKEKLKHGMNFAFGGTGVFTTLNPLPNMTTQIDFFQNMTNHNIYSWQDLQSSIAFVSLSGNDYGAFLARNSSAQGLQEFIPKVVNQLVINLKRIHYMGVKRVAVTSLQPLGCLPQTTVVSSYQNCSSSENAAVLFHNLLLQQAVGKINNETNDSPFVVLDLYGSFMSSLQNKGTKKFETPLKPCCVGASSGYSCGSVDANGVKKYTVCGRPDSAFFWDTVHPTQAGWSAVYTNLQSTLQRLTC